MFSLDGKAALIAGGTKGVGLEIAKTLARMGATLALNYAHNDEAAAAALDQVKAIASKSVLLKADLEDEEQTRRMVRQAASDLGGLDIFIMNAVSTTTKSLLTVKPRSFWRTMAMNVGGFLVSRAGTQRADLRQRTDRADFRQHHDALSDADYGSAWSRQGRNGRHRADAGVRNGTAGDNRQWARSGAV